jgi:hemerythrin superfamily protein
MNATRTRSRKTSSKKSASARGRSGSTSRGTKGKSTRGTASKKSASRKSASKKSASKKSTSRKSTSTRGKSSSRAKSTPVGQAIELLTEDHRKVQKLFRQAERVKDDLKRLRPIVEEVCAALTLHSEIEEEHFYPVVRESIKESDLIAEAFVEHASAKQLIAQLQSGEAEDEQYAATFTVLGEYVNHHIKEEEGEIFPKARRARGDFEPLVEALMEEHGQAGEMAGGARASKRQDQESGQRSARGRQGRGRARRETAAGEPEGRAAGGMGRAEGDVEQPRRGRRGASEESTGETEATGRGREQESIEQEERGSRDAGH